MYGVEMSAARARLSRMSADRSRVRMDDLTVERVLRVVEAIPAGRVAAYGEVGSIVGVGPRLVGRILREWGSSVPWWRVTNAAGEHPLLARALPHWEAEGIEVTPTGRGCRMEQFGADLAALQEASAPALSELEVLDGPDGVDGLDGVCE